MGTRSQAFTAKIKNLQELQLRLVSGSVPQPQGHEVANSLKYFRLVKFTESTKYSQYLNQFFFLQNIKYTYFSATLLGVLRDVPGQPMVMMRCRERDAERLSLFPSLDYKGLYSTLLQFLDLVHLFQVCFFTIIILYQFKRAGIFLTYPACL